MVNEEQTAERRSRLSTESELVRALADLSILSDENLRAAVTEHITSVYNVKTPVEKVKRRPDGLDYIESTWMDKTWKEFSPLYEYSLLMHNESLGYIDIIVILKDRVTGNTELGAGSARIQVKQGSREAPGYSNIIDKSNSLKAALTNAIKNAQSRFGIGADIYGKRESVRTNEEETRFKSMLLTIKKINSTRAHMFEVQWEDLGVDYTEFLDRWQVFIDHSSAESTSGDIAGDDRVTGEKSLFNQKTSDVAKTAGTMKKVKF